MSKGHVDLKSQGASQRRLSIIYFIDSAKTRSISIPLGRLNLILGLIFLIFSWSFASVFVIAWLGEEQTALSTRLKSSLGTIFDYQSRFDNVYELAYPPASQSPDAGLDPAPPGLRAEEYAEHMPSEPSKVPPSAPPQGAAIAGLSSPSSPAPEQPPSQISGGAVPGHPPSAPNSAVPMPSPPAPPPSPAEDKSTPAATGDVLVTVGNTTLEKGQNGVALHFELANRSTRTRAEGYIWAVAEFVADDGQRFFIGAPRELKLNGNGDPTNPEKATYFGIKRFKKQSFSFPLIKGRPGTFTAVRIGIMDLSGEGRRSYRLSTEVRVR